MLQDYALGSGEANITYETNRDMTFTTAETSIQAYMSQNGDSFKFTATFKEEDGRLSTDSKSTAIIRRQADFTGSSMFAKAGDAGFTATNIILDGGSVQTTVNGGIINATAGSLKIQTGAVLRNSKTTSNGGAVYVASGATVEMTGGEITGNEAVNGGAVYVVSGGTATLKDGTKTVSGTATPTSVTIAGNTVRTIAEGAATARVDVNKGAGIYLAEGARLNMEGSPSFVKDDATNSLTDTTNAYPGDPAKTNGQQEVYTDGKVRQDIYMKGYANVTSGDTTTETLATSIVVTGALDVDPGSIWVWAAAQSHYRMLTQFAVFGGGAVQEETVEGEKIHTLTLSEEDLVKTYAAFRNAQADLLTGCGGDYLTGQEDNDATVTIEGVEKVYKCIKWTGGFDIVLRKIDGYGNAIGTTAEGTDGATFNLYLSEKDDDDKYVPKTKEEGGKQVYEPYKQADTEVTAISRRITAENAVAIKVNKGNDDTPILTEKKVYGDGLAVFEKIPPGVYFMIETCFPLVSETTQHYKAVEDMYMLDVNAKGYYTLYVAGVDDSGNAVWSTSNDKAPTTSFIKDGDKYKAPTGPVDSTDVLPVYTVMNVLPYKRKVALRKADVTKTSESITGVTSLSGARFRIFRADMTEVTDGQPMNDGKPVGYYESGKSGVYFMGKLPFGTYYLVETVAPTGYTGNLGKVFTLTVGKDTTAEGGSEGGGTKAAGTKVDLLVKLNATGSEDAIVEAFRRYMTTGENTEETGDTETAG